MNKDRAIEPLTPLTTTPRPRGRGARAHVANKKVTVAKALVLLSTSLLLCGGAAHEHPGCGATCGAGTMEAALKAARELADDRERKVILRALERIKAGATKLSLRKNKFSKNKIGDGGAWRFSPRRWPRASV